ncbi:T9SS type A sorting domain-containing protein [Flavivirga rizhaonensis]|nr:T9SS type A sorting domain-containing protein [Flavivirga rizhaonensis]
MKKITPLKSLAFLITCLLVVTFGYGQEIISYSSVANAGCSGIISSDPNIDLVSTSGICRSSGINANAGATYNSRDWTTSASIDVNDYLEWTLTPDSGYEIDLTTMDLTYDRSGTGPTMVDIQVDTGSGFSSIFTDASVSAGTENNNGIDLSTITGITGTITFRLYAYNSTGATGTFDIDENTATNKGIVINGTVSALPTCSSPTVTWTAGAWSPVTGPNINTPVIIADDYDTSTGSFRACSLTVNSGFTLNIIDNTFVEVQNDVDVDGNITVQNHGAFVQNDDASSFTLGTGTSLVRKSTSILNNWYDYTYWSSPVSGLTIATSPLVDSDRRYWYDATNYLDILAEVGNTGVYNSGSDDIDDDGNDWQFAGNTYTMDAGVGFAATHSRIGYIGALSYNYNFNGAFNNGPYTTSISYNSANTGGHWNLIGNPYPCALDFNAFYTANSAVVDGAAYLWSHRTAPSSTTSGNENLNFSQNDYAIITAGSGSINNSDNGDGVFPNDYIPSGQGFFIAGLSNGNVTFNNSMRMADGTSNSQFFKNSNSKKKNNSIDNKLWVNLTSDNGIFNQVLVAYVDGATNENDGMAYDAPRILSSGGASIIYTLINEESNKKYAIQGKNTNSINEEEVIPLGFYTSIELATLYKLSVAKIQGDFLNNNTIYLKDNILNKIHDLSTSDYTFTSEVGEFNDRFEIVFNASSLSVDNIATDKNSLSIVELDNDHVQFKTSNSLNIKAVAIYDLLGRQLYNFKGQKSSETYKLSNLNSTIYMAQVTLSNGTIITKKAVKK